MFNFLKFEQELNDSTESNWFLSNRNSRNLWKVIPKGIEVIPFCCNIIDSILLILKINQGSNDEKSVKNEKNVECEKNEECKDTQLSYQYL